MRSEVAKALVSHGKRLLEVASTTELLARSGAVARELLGASVVYAVCTGPGQDWGRAVHVAVAEEPRPLSPKERSALFALHRQLVHENRTIVVDDAGQPGVIGDSLAADMTSPYILAVPVFHRTGRMMGELVAVWEAQSDRADAEEIAVEIAGLMSASFDHVRRLAFARRDQDRLHLLAEASDEAFWDWVFDAGEMWWGGGLQDLLGGLVVSNRPDWKFSRIHPEDAERVRRSLQDAIASADSRWSEEYRFLRADDTYITVEDRAHFLREPTGRAYRIIGSLRDVSAIKQSLEREREARKVAERATRAKDDFLAMLGHELRNPLAPIVTALQLLKLRGIDSIERERKVIERQARHMVSLIDDLLDVSRIARGLVVLRAERVELATLVARAIEMATPLLEERRHFLGVDIPQGLQIDADPNRFAQILANLLTNAAKYTEAGGRIAIDARTVGPSVEIAVSDTGVGIAPELQPRIFDMFVQEDQDIDRSRGGLGLGLSIVRSLVRMHGGTVSLRSEGRGCGSCFTVRVPLPADAAKVQQPRPASTPEERLEPGSRILVVDDNRDAAMLLANYLQQGGYAVCCAHDGPSALASYKDFAPEIVLLDIGLPVIDGYEVAAILRQNPKPPVLIAITGYGQDSHRRRAEESGFDDHLVKPVEPALIEKVMVREMRRRGAASTP